MFGLPNNVPCEHKDRMANKTRFMIDTSEELRIRYLYRKLILDGKVALSCESAKKIIGPDCAYHCYSVPNMTKKLRRRKRS